MLNCKEAELDHMNWAAVSVALTCTLTIWGKMMGPHIGGAAAVANVPGPLREWALADWSGSSAQPRRVAPSFDCSQWRPSRPEQQRQGPAACR